MRHLAGALLAMLAAMLVLAVPATPAYAHAQLVSTLPGNGERLDTAPAEIVLRFSERVNLVAGGVQLLGPGGAVAGTGPARIDPVAPAQVRMALPATLGTGAYTVSWRVVSADSHPLHGAFVFGVGVTELGPLPDAGAQTGADTTVSAAFWLFRWLGYAALAVLAGGVCFLAFCWPAGWAQRRARHVVTAGWVASVVSAVVVLLLQGPYATGAALTRAADPALLAATMDTDYGRFVVARLALLAIAAVMVLTIIVRAQPLDEDAPPGSNSAGPLGEEPDAATRRRLRSLGWLAAGVLALALPATWVGTGHANAESSLLPALADTAHLSAMAVWFGGLVTLMICALPSSVARPVPELAQALTRFSRTATVCVGVLVLTGLYQAWRGVGSVSALSGSTYGTLLVFKLGIVGVLLWLGWMSRSLVRRRYLLTAANDPAEVSVRRSVRRAARAEQAQEHVARRQLRLSVRAEVAIAATVLALTSMLVATPPAARPDAATPVAAPAVTSTRLALAEGAGLDVLFEPARSGTHALTLTVRRADGAAWDVPEVTAALVLPEQSLGPLPVELTKVAPGEYRALSVTVPLPGTWRLQVTVRTSEIDQTTVAANLDVL